MTVIWGLDLREIQWWKFKSSYMWNNEYHLRRTKFIVYQIAMICCVVSESLGTAALSDYVDQQDYVAHHAQLAETVTVHNDDFIGAASYNIFVGVFVATIFGAGFFFDLFWPERHESPSVKLAWRICAIIAAVCALSTALTMTVIVARHEATLTPNTPYAAMVLAAYGGSPLRYSDNGRAIASVVFIWLGFLGTVASAVLLWVSYAHNDKYGPKSKHARHEPKEIENEVEPTGMSGFPATHAEPTIPAPTHDAAPNKETYEGV